MCGGAGLAETVTLFDARLDARVDGLDEFLGQRGGARVHHPQTGEVVFVHDWVFAQEEDDGGHDVAEGDAVVLDVGAPFLQVEFLHYYQVVALVEGLVEEASQACVISMFPF